MQELVELKVHKVTNYSLLYQITYSHQPTTAKWLLSVWRLKTNNIPWMGSEPAFSRGLLSPCKAILERSLRANDFCSFSLWHLRSENITHDIVMCIQIRSLFHKKSGDWSPTADLNEPYKSINVTWTSCNRANSMQVEAIEIIATPTFGHVQTECIFTTV